MQSRFAYMLSPLLLTLPFTMFAVQRYARKITITEAVWVGTTLLNAGDYEVKWNGPGAVEVGFRQRNKPIVTVPAIVDAGVAGPHDRAAVKVRMIGEGSKALERLIWNDVSLTFEPIHPF